ncbi:Metallo-dependent phosphatase-like protein, partial [Obelidium mucronatum]
MMGKLLRRFTGKATPAPTGSTPDGNSVSSEKEQLETNTFKRSLSSYSQRSSYSSQGPPTHRLKIITVNDVYKMHMLPSLATAIDIEKAKGFPLIVLLPGDFISPSLLSSLDKGFGMIDVLNQVGVDYVCFGNHEDDVDFASLKSRVAQSNFVWVNTNIPGIKLPEDVSDRVPLYSVVDVSSKEGKLAPKKVGILGLCTDDQHLYKPGHFGGATILPVNGTAMKYAEILKDLDLKTSNGSQLIKTGIDAAQFSVIDVEWFPGVSTPTIPRIINRKKQVQESVDKHLRAVELLKASVLCEIPKHVILSSKHVRRRPCTMGIFLCSVIRDSLNTDCCIINAGTFRGNRKYGAEAEMPFNSEIAQYHLPGRVINEVLAFSRAPRIGKTTSGKGWIYAKFPLNDRQRSAWLLDARRRDMKLNEYLKLKLFCMAEMDFHGHDNDDDDPMTPGIVDVEKLEKELERGTGIYNDAVAESVIASMEKDGAP